MVTLEELSSWIKENTSLSESSIYKYSRAVNNISKEMLAKCVIPVSLFELSSLQLDWYIPIILDNPDFKEKNSTGNNMYSNALKQFRMFRTANPDAITHQHEIVNAISGYSTLGETERTAIIKSRVGQGLFRKKLIEKYNGSCVVTGVTTQKLLIASHIKPWAASNNDERLSEENGLLLTPTYDKLFDYGLITFSNLGKIIVSPQLSAGEISKLKISSDVEYNIKATAKMREHLDYHRDKIFVRSR